MDQLSPRRTIPAVTQRDVARRAQVSVRTVSNVINDFPLVSAGVRSRVLQAVAELGYRPNVVARHLRRGRTGMLALAIPELVSPYFAELSSHVIGQAAQRDTAVVIEQTGGDPEEERRLLARPERLALFDGLAFSPLGLGTAELRALNVHKPMVLLGERGFGRDFDHVAIDNVTAARAATEHLIGLGRQRIGAIGDQVVASGETAHYRTRGYQDALRAAGRPYNRSLVIRAVRFDRACGAQAMARLLDLAKPPDAVFCYNDLLALGALRTALRRGVRVPDDVAIIGFDDIEDGRYSTPSLSTVAPDKEAIAQLTLDRLFARLAGSTEPPATLIAPYRLVVRESTSGSEPDPAPRSHRRHQKARQARVTDQSSDRPGGGEHDVLRQVPSSSYGRRR